MLVKGRVYVPIQILIIHVPKKYLMRMFRKSVDFIIYPGFQFLGQKLVEWHQLDVSSFLDQVTGFLGEHGQLDGLSSSPPKKCARSVSMTEKW